MSKDTTLLPVPSVTISDTDDTSPPSSRRASAIIAALRRPSQAVALSAAHAVMNQRRYLLGLLHGQSEKSIHDKDIDYKDDALRKENRKLGE